VYNAPDMQSFDLPRYFSHELDEHLAVAGRTKLALVREFGRLVEICATSLHGGGKLMFFGNGGSAADAQHIATEFSVRYKTDRRALAAVALTTDGPTMTAIGNDLGYDRVFSRQIEAFGRKGDVAIGISTSGSSPNVLLALKTAREMGIVAAGFGGKDGGDMKALADPLLIVPSDTTARIQEMHHMLGQMLCGALEHALGLVE
jgi:D-sedoheptulose 7-phosphate isomerase